MSDSETPKIDVKITPIYNPSSQVQSLDINLVIDTLGLEAGDTLVFFPLATEKRNAVIQCLSASDEDGEVPIDTTGDSWIVGRNTTDQISLNFCAEPTLNDAAISPKTAISIQEDEGGILGSGFSFMPIPPGSLTYGITITWDLVHAPLGTRAVWTYGEGPSPITQIGPASILADSVYMIGPISSDPPSPIAGSTSDYYGYYWMGTLPENLALIRDIHHEFYLKVLSFFNRKLSSSTPYRTFILKCALELPFNPGISLTHSYILTYAPSNIAYIKDYTLIRHTAHAFISEFLSPPSPTPYLAPTAWLYHGIKHTLSIYLPFRPHPQFRTGDYFSHTICTLCTLYYTSPYLHLHLSALLALAEVGDIYALSHLEARAWAFVISCDFAARKLVQVTKPPIRPVEDMAMKPLADGIVNGNGYGVQEWIEKLEPLMGADVRERFEAMERGTVIFLPVEVFGAKSHRLVEIQQEVLDFGFDMKSFEERVVTGLKRESRAEKAGLREGDTVVRWGGAWRCIEVFEEELEVVIKRGEEEIAIKYWPRGEKVGSWQMIKVKGE